MRLGALPQRERQERLGQHGGVDRSSLQRAEHLRERDLDEPDVAGETPLRLSHCSSAMCAIVFGASIAMRLPTRSRARADPLPLRRDERRSSAPWADRARPRRPAAPVRRETSGSRGRRR